ncbi:MAG: hypothetical protein WAU91_16795 [Desulfatitalea sp.]
MGLCASKPLHAAAAIANLGSSQEFIYDANGNMLTGPDISTPDAP